MLVAEGRVHGLIGKLNADGTVKTLISPAQGVRGPCDVPQRQVPGLRGSLYRVNPWNGKAKELASGLAGPTNLAITGAKIYVTELDAGRISLVERGKVCEYLPLPGALSIEAGRHGALHAGTLYTGPASVVKIDTHKGWRH